MSQDYKFPVWGTQGGGLVRDVNGKYIFVTEPSCPGLKVGDEMPDEWGIAPANDQAREEHHKIDQGFEEFFDVAFRMRDNGEISTETIRDFFRRSSKLAQNG